MCGSNISEELRKQARSCRALCGRVDRNNGITEGFRDYMGRAMWARGSTGGACLRVRHFVAPYAGAWIETHKRSWLGYVKVATVCCIAILKTASLNDADLSVYV